MHIVVTGGTGFIGRALCKSLFRDGHRVTILTRKAREASHLLGAIVTAVEWNGREGGVWEQCLEGVDAVVNLAGAPIAEARWTGKRKRLLTDSRVLTTRLLVEAMSRRSFPPQTLISASGIGYYGAATIEYWMRMRPPVEGSWLVCAWHGKRRPDAPRSSGRESLS